MVTEIQKDWGSEDRWLITMGRGKPRTWRVYQSNKCGNSMDPLSQHATFAEAHAAYLNAVTPKPRRCDFGEPKCPPCVSPVACASARD